MRCITALCLTAVTALPLLAQHEEPGEFHRHHLAALIAGSHSSGRSGFTAGGDYEFRFARPFGIIATGEYAGGAFREDVFVLTPAFHPWRGLKAFAGPGFDRELRRETEPAAEAAHEKNIRALFRFGGGYDFRLGRGFTIGPDLALDLLKGEKVVVYGVNFGFGFGRR